MVSDKREKYLLEHKDESLSKIHITPMNLPSSSTPTTPGERPLSTSTASVDTKIESDVEDKAKRSSASPENVKSSESEYINLMHIFHTCGV